MNKIDFVKNSYYFFFKLSMLFMSNPYIEVVQFVH